MPSSEAVRAYLAEVLALDPLRQTEDLLDRRQSFLGIPALAARPDRIAAAEELDRIRAEFWRLEPADIVRRISALDLRPFPDLSRTAARLERVASMAARVAQLAVEPKADPECMGWFKQVVVARPGEVAHSRDAFHDKLQDRRWLASVLATEALVRRKYPDVRSLAEDWWTSIRRLPVERRLARQLDHHPPAESESSWERALAKAAFWIVALIVIRVVSQCVQGHR